MFLTFRYRIKDGNSAARRALRKQASAVNYIWNYCCEIDRLAQSRWKLGTSSGRPSAYDLATLCRGVTKELGVHSDTVDAVCAKFCQNRSEIFPRTPRFRTGKKNLGWIPVSNFNRAAKLSGDVLLFLKRKYRLWLSRPIPENGKPKTWDFSCDNRGRWYFNIQIELPDAPTKDGVTVAVDLGLKTLATLSDGTKIETPAFFRASEGELARLQRFGMKRRARTLQVKIANRRKHFLHVATTDLVRRYGKIIVGDVNAAKLTQTRMAKSVHDAGWATFRDMLRYKAIGHGVIYLDADERFSSVTCSSCGARSGPKGQKGLRVREWACSECGTVHDRDVNAAKNILGAERRPPGVGIAA